MTPALTDHTVLCGASDFGLAIVRELLRRDPRAAIVVVDGARRPSVAAPNLHWIAGDPGDAAVRAAAGLASAATLILADDDDVRNLQATYLAVRENPAIEAWVRLSRADAFDIAGPGAPARIHFVSAPAAALPESRTPAIAARRRLHPARVIMHPVLRQDPPTIPA